LLYNSAVEIPAGPLPIIITFAIIISTFLIDCVVNSNNATDSSVTVSHGLSHCNIEAYFFLYKTSHKSTIGIMLLILLFLLGGKKMLKVNELLNIAIAELVNMLPGELFLVRDLFKGCEWNRIEHLVAII